MKSGADDFLPFTDDFIFSRVMQDTEICTGILERILPDEEFYNIQLLSNEPDIQNHNVCGNEFIEKLDAKVREYNTPEWRRIHLTFDYHLDRQEEIGKEIGEENERNRFNNLILSLTNAGRINDLSRAAADPEYQKQLFEEFNL